MTENLTLHYEVVPGWPNAEAHRSWTEVTAVAVDSQNRIHVLAREPNRMLVFDEAGTLLHEWGAGLFVRPHGLTIGPDDRVHCSDDLDHTVKVFTLEGKPLLTLGTGGKPSDTGATSIDYRTIKRSAGPFYFPTNVANAADGSIFITDGYGNARVHHFTAEGKLLHSWGEPGAGPGQFHVPHGIAIDRDGIIHVADRENSRIQMFSQSGEYVGEMNRIARPCQVAFDPTGNMLVAELGYKAGMWPGTTPPSPEATGGRVSVYSPERKLLARFGGGTNPTAAGDFFAPHDIRSDRQGNLYVAEVVYSAGGRKGMVPPDCHALQKFRPVKNEGER